MRTAECLIDLVKAVVNKETPKPLPDDVSIDELVKLAASHSIDNLLCYALEKSEVQPPAELRQKRDMAVLRNFVQLDERDALIVLFTSAGIDVVPLKGCYMKEIYPQPDFRTMGDLDILIRPAALDKAKQLLTERGYRLEEEQEHHTTFFFEPHINLNLHVKLVEESSGFSANFANIWNDVVQNPTNPHLYELSQTERYVFMMAHLAKHYFRGGTGIRSVLDVYVFERFGGELDMKAVSKRLDEIGILEFCDGIRRLAQAWFGGGEHDLETKQLGEFILRSGTYGTSENAIRLQKDKLGNGRYLAQKVFAPLRIMKKRYPILKKLPLLLPLMWIVRWLDALIFRRRRIAKEIAVLSEK